MAKKYYVVIKGKKTGIFESWNEVKDYVTGFKGAIYKSFLDKNEAKQYFDSMSSLNNEIDDDNTIEKELEMDKENNIYSFFVDGSFNKYFQKIGFGVVCVFGKIIHEHSQTLTKNQIKDFSDSLNIVGEVFGSLYAIEYAIKNKIQKIKIYFDYEGIEKWAIKAWGAKSKIALYYVDQIEKLKKNNIEIHFQKVKAHVDIKYNEIADKLAKNAVSIKK